MEARIGTIQKDESTAGSPRGLRLRSYAVLKRAHLYTLPYTPPLLIFSLLTKFSKSSLFWILPERKGRIQGNLFISEMGKAIPAVPGSQSFSEGHMMIGVIELLN